MKAGDIQESSKTDSTKIENKCRELKKSFSLPDLSMNITYIMKWLSKTRKSSNFGGEWKLRKINKSYYSDYSLNEITKNIKKRHSDPFEKLIKF